MGLFKTKKRNNDARRPPSLPNMIFETTDDDNESSVPTHKKGGAKKKFSLYILKRTSTNNNKRQHQQQQQTISVDPTTVIQDVKQNDYEVDEEKDDEEDLGDIPRSISTPSRDILDPLPPLPPTPKDDEEERLKQIWHQLQQYSDLDLDKDEEEDDTNDQDSLGSPCEFILKRQQLQRQRLEQLSRTITPSAKVDSAVANSRRRSDNNNEKINHDIDSHSNNDSANNANNISVFDAATDEQQATFTEHASMEHLPHYIAALSPSLSPDTSVELSARSLSCLFTLSEVDASSSSDTLKQQQQQRVDMVNGSIHDKNNNGSMNTTPTASSTSLIPALLSFLQRCPQNSSEQYLTLLVLNNLSIPMQNKRTIALQYDGVKILARMLCEDPGCHLLVIIIVNLTFGDLELNRELLTMGTSDVSTTTLSCHGSSDDWNRKEVQLVQSLGYVLLVSCYFTFNCFRIIAIAVDVHLYSLLNFTTYQII